MIDVVVIGGGVSGLAAAYQLRCQGFDVTVLERQARTGGNAISERRNGFLIEHGPSTINAAVAQVKTLSSSLELDASVVPLSEAVKRRYLVKDDALSGIPAHPLGFLTSSYLSLPGRLRLLAETLVPRGSAATEETVKEYFSRRFGAEFANRVMDPLVGGLYAGRADELSLLSVFPKLVQMEQGHGSITRAAFVNRLRGGAMPGRRLYSWANGIGSLPSALSAALAGNIRTGVTVRGISRHRNGYDIDTVKHGKIAARAVLVATQPHVAATFLEDVAPDGAAAVGAIDAPSLAVVYLGYKRENVDHPIDGLGYLTPSSEHGVLTGAQFPSSMFAGRAPQGYVALTGYLGGARYPEVGKLGAKDLLNLAQEEFGRLLGVRGEPEITNVRCWSRGIPQYRHGHRTHVENIRNISQESPGMFVTGNYFDGPSVGACVANAQEAAGDIARFLKSDLAGNEDSDLAGVKVVTR